VVQRRKERLHAFGGGKICRRARDEGVGITVRVRCGCKLVDWERENLGIKFSVFRLEDAEST
jgi:hypothetical protein